MADNSTFDFCPKCGALARDGVCQSCGYPSTPQTPPGQSGTNTGQNPYAQGQSQNTSQPQYSQQQGVFTGQPQYTEGQGIPVPQPQAPQGQGGYAVHPQQPQGQGMYTGQPQYTQGPFSQQPVPNGAQGYSPYVNVVPPEIKKKGSKKTAIILSIVIGVVVIALITLILLVAGNVLNTYRNSGSGSGGLGSIKDKEYTEEYISEEDNDEKTINAGAAFIHYTSDTTSVNLGESGQDTSLPYYSGPYNAIKTDLSYQIGFTTDSCYSQLYPNIGIEVEYPQIISGEVPSKSDINNALYYEYSYYEDYLKEFVGEITGEEDSF